jgi:glycosyltransferase involved in cell wall biosynthesis
MSSSQPRILVVHGVPPGAGGLGTHVSQVLRALAPAAVVVAAGPGDPRRPHPGVVSFPAPRPLPPAAARFTPLRWYQGTAQLISDRAVGAWAAKIAERERPDLVYTFTQVGLEVLQWARENGVRSILDNPNGHIADHREVCAAETRKWCDAVYRLHPAAAMVERVTAEYALADRVRVSSDWAKYSMVERGIAPGRIEVVPLEVDIRKFAPAGSRGPSERLRIAFTSSVSMGKGFVYLLRALHSLGPDLFSLIMTSATGDRCSRRLFEEESRGVEIVAAEHPAHAYAAADLLVSPTLHDGFGFVVGEAMASGLPVITTDRCGAADWMREVDPNWVLPAGDERALAVALSDALSRRESLVRMGRAARAVAERRGSEVNLRRLAVWAMETVPH